MRRMHILLVNNYNIRGGIPLMTCTLANAMAERGHRVTIYNQKPLPRLLLPLYKLAYALAKASTPPGQLISPPNSVHKRTLSAFAQGGSLFLHFHRRQPESSAITKKITRTQP